MMRKIGIVLLVIFLGVGIIFMVLQSSWGARKILATLNDVLQESGWSAQEEEIKGNLLEKISLRNVQIQSPQGDLIIIDTLDLRFSLLRLLSKEICFTQFHANGIRWERKKIQPSSTTEKIPASSGLPFALNFSDLRLTGVTLPYSEEIADIRGVLRVGRRNSNAYCKLLAQSRDFVRAKARFSFFVRSNKETICKIDLTSPTFAVFSPWIQLPMAGRCALSSIIQGPWSAFSSHLFGGTTAQPIRATLSGSVSIIDASLNNQVADAALKRNWSIDTSLELLGNKDLRISHLSLESDPFSVKGHFSQREVDLTFASSIDRASVHLLARQTENRWDGSVKMHAEALGQMWDGGCVLYQNDQGVKIENLVFGSSLAYLEGQLQIFPSFLIEGECKATAPNLHELLPASSLYGPFNATSRLKIEQNTQILEVDANSSNLFYGRAQIDQAYLYANLIDPFSNPHGHATAGLDHLRLESLFIDTVTLDTEANANIWPTSLKLEGDWKGPFSLTMNGNWQTAKRSFLVHLQELTGSLLSYPIALSAPADLAIGPELFKLSDLEISIGTAIASTRIDRQGDTSSVKLLLDRVPLDFLSINPLELAVKGTIHLDAELAGKGKDTQGSLSAEISEVEIASLIDRNPINGDAKITAKIADQRLALDFGLTVREQQVMQWTANLPLEVSLFSWQAKLLENKKATSQFSFDGRIEELLDFFDLGANRLEGDLHCLFNLHGTLEQPFLSGNGHFENGTYENYITGTMLQNLKADLVANRSSILLKSLTAQDSQKKGSLSMNGKLQVLFKKRFPFRLDGEFSRLNVADIDWAKAEVGGSIHIIGNLDSARVSGKAVVLETDMSIPERLPSSLPRLQVKYVNVQQPLAPSKSHAKPYPIFFDIRVFAPDGVFVSGRGLSSEWKGDFQIGGTYTNIEARGQLELLAGEFRFSGRGFKLSDGTLTFSGRPHEMPILNIGARFNLPNLAILARLKGFLNTPQLSFQSIPPLPMGSILSYLLFGQDLSDINAIQAAQLVNSISSLSGHGPDIMENTRRSIGVDRLRIIAAPLGPEGGETYALQVGKYVTRGVLVSVSQGTEGSSTNIAIEVDLFNGFVFEAESQREQEQGKFTLKWNLNY